MIFFRNRDGKWYIGFNNSKRNLKFVGNDMKCVNDVDDFFSFNYRRPEDKGDRSEAFDSIICL